MDRKQQDMLALENAFGLCINAGNGSTTIQQSRIKLESNRQKNKQHFDERLTGECE